MCALEGLLLIGTVGWQWYSAIAVAIPALVSLVFLIVSYYYYYCLVNGIISYATMGSVQSKEGRNSSQQNGVCFCIPLCSTLNI